MRREPFLKNTKRAYIVFTGQTDVRWLRLLKPGYRHCFVLLEDEERWISVDPLLNHMEVQTHEITAGFDLAGWLRGRGHRVVGVDVNRSNERAAPVMLFTCVEAVKRIIGLHDWRVVTPWQLCRRLEGAP